MELERYQTSISRDHKVYSFVSIGNNGKFIKKVIFTEIDQDGLYNLGLGDYNPKAWIYTYGSTTARTKLYRIGISTHLEETSADFEIFGELEHGWERFKKDSNYRAFIIKLKDEDN